MECVTPVLFHQCYFIWTLSYRHLTGLAVECQPAALKAGFKPPDGEPQNFQYRLSPAETQLPVDRMQRKARGCLVLNILR